MKAPQASATRGSVIVMVTFAILVLFAAVGMVVDIGWSYFTRRRAQVAADAAAQAGARRALELGNAAGNFTTLGPNNPDIIARATAYATHNGYTDEGGAPDARRFVKITSGPDPLALAAPLSQMNILYWVEATVTHRLSGFFWGVTGPGSDLFSGATAVAAVVMAPLEGSILLLNTVCNVGGTVCGGAFLDEVAFQTGGAAPGTNMYVHGNSKITAPGGIIINSSANGVASAGRPANYAMVVAGASEVRAPYVSIARDGPYQGLADPASLGNILDLSGNPKGPIPGPQIKDPTLAINFSKQPRVSTVAETLALTGGVVYGINGAFGGSAATPASLNPGTYVGFDLVGGVPQPNLNGVQIKGDTQFLPGNYVFLGGLDIQGADVKFSEGVYTMAGAEPKSGAAGLVFNVTSNSKLTDAGAGSKGELFVFTDINYGLDSGYPVLLDTANSYSIQPLNNSTGGALGPPGAPRPFGALGGLQFGKVEMQAGQTDKADVDMHGLRGGTPCNPGICPSAAAELYLYEPIMMWQDRLNKLYTQAKQAALIEAHAGTLQGLHGTVYQPQGSLFRIVGSTSQTGDAQIITGALESAGGNDLTLTPILLPVLVAKVSLIR